MSVKEQVLTYKLLIKPTINKFKSKTLQELSESALSYADTCAFDYFNLYRD